MPPRRAGAGIRLLPSLTDAAFLLPVVLLLLGFGNASRMLEGDTGWHIRTGDWIIQHGRIPDRDIFSFTKSGEPWFAWEWLWDVAFAWLHQHGGLAAVVFVSLLVLCLTSALLFRLVRRSCPNSFVALVVAWAAMGGSSIHWWARPHVFTFLFAVAFLMVLESIRSGNRRIIWLLPCVMVPWVNLHGGFIVGLLLTGAYAIGEYASGLVATDRPTARLAYSRGALYTAACAVCGLATLLNPYTYNLHVHVWRTLTDHDSPLYRFVGEWQPIALRGAVALYVEPILVLAIAGAVWHLVNRRLVYPLLLLAWLHAGFAAARNLPIFMLVAAPSAAAVVQEGIRRLCAAAALPGWLRRAASTFEATASEFGVVDRMPRLHAASVCAAALLALLFFAPNPPDRLRAAYDPKLYPVKAVDAAAEALSRAVFAEDEWGDYLIYRLYPGGKVFVDGRFDFYGGKFTREYISVMDVKYDWEKTLDSYGIATVLVSAEKPLASTLKESRRWQAVYDDGVAIVFRSRRIPAGASSSTVASDIGKPTSQAARTGRDGRGTN